MGEQLDSGHTDDVMLTLYRNSLRGKNTDFSIVVGNTTISCHASVVCALSPYFDSLYISGLRRAELDEHILLKDEAIVQQVIRFLYLGTIDLSDETVVTVLQAANFIKYDKLAAHCQNYMLATLSTENYRSYSAAATNFHLTELSAACKAFPRRNFSALAATSWFLKALSASELVAYFQDDDLQVSGEDNVLDALWKWLNSCTDSEEKKAEHLEQLIPFVRLSLCSPQKLSSLRKDKAVPAIMKVKLYEFQHDGRKGEKKRNSSTTTPASTTTAASPNPLSPGGADDAKIVLVCGRKTNNTNSDQIMYLNERQENIEITKAEGFVSLSLYHVCFDNDDITISGGIRVDKNESVSGINSYNTRTRHWTKHPNMKQARCRHASAIIHQLLYIIAGRFESPGKETKYIKEVEVLNLSTGRWEKASDIPHTVMEPAAAVVNGQIVVAGGGDSDGKWTKKTVKYDPGKDTWVYCASMPQSRATAATSAVPVGNHLFILARQDFLVFDVFNDQWTTLEAPPVPSYRCAMLLHNNTLIALGGCEHWDNKNPHGRIQKYDIQTKTWSVEKESMTTPLSFHYACLMPLPK